MKPDIRPSPIAGSWYPGIAIELSTMLERYLLPVESTLNQLRGIMAPHAGLRFSGPVAGYSFRYLREHRVDIVVVISPSHHAYPAPLLTSAHTHFETPLGRVPVAHDILRELGQKLELLPVRNDPEHAIEIELPFLQHTLGEFQLVPLAMLDQSYAAAQTLAPALRELLPGKSVLYVASSDLSHFYTQAVANQLDRTLLNAVATYDPAEVIHLDETGQGFACGRGAIAAVMLACGANTATIEHYATSGDVTHDFSRVVGYGAATFHVR